MHEFRARVLTACVCVSGSAAERVNVVRGLWHEARARKSSGSAAGEHSPRCLGRACYAVAIGTACPHQSREEDEKASHMLACTLVVVSGVYCAASAVLRWQGRWAEGSCKDPNPDSGVDQGGEAGLLH